MSKKNLVLQVYGPQENEHKRFPKHEKLFLYSKKCANKYAQQLNADYYLHEKRSFPNELVCFEKLIVWNDNFVKYDNIFFLDSDAIITPSCPNIFEYQKFAAKPETHTTLDLLDRRFINNKQYTYFNSGVMLFTKSFLSKTKDIYLDVLNDLKIKYKQSNQKFYDQMFFNYIVSSNEPDYEKLSEKWNIAPNKHTQEIPYIKENYVIHYMRKRKEWFDETIWQREYETK